MKDYFMRRILLIFPTLLGISLACFLIMHFVPGGPVEQAIMKMRASRVGQEAGSYFSGSGQSSLTMDEIERIKKYYGFDKPVLVRYFTWLGKVLRFDFGNSYTYDKPVMQVILSRIPISLTFGLTGLFFTYLVCIPLINGAAYWFSSAIPFPNLPLVCCLLFSSAAEAFSICSQSAGWFPIILKTSAFSEKYLIFFITCFCRCFVM